MPTRRDILANTLVLGGGALACAMLDGAPVLAFPGSRSVVDQLKALEDANGGRLGVAILDTGSKKLVSYRGSERFPLCSTFKVLAAACVLSRVDQGRETLERRISYKKADLLSYAPITSQHADTGMTLEELCAAAVEWSDNSAGNMLLESFGGPAGLTAYMRASGDPITRLDRREPDLNEALPGDPRDTTTPAAMVKFLQRTILGHALTPQSRDLLTGWLVACRTGDKKIRAGVPTGWRVGDKTGAGERNATNDVAVIWPPERAPIIVSCYFVGSTKSDDERASVLASVGHLATMG